MKALIANRLRALEQRLAPRYRLSQQDKKFLLNKYRLIFGRRLDLAKVQTFTEKLFYRMIMISRYGDPTITRLSDKFSVREYVEQAAGAKYLVDLFWSGMNPNEIPFEELPLQYVIKTNNACGTNLVVRAPVDRLYVIETLRAWLQINYYWVNREYQYHEIPPRIVVEQYLDDGHACGPLDYRFWCFGGHPELIQVDNSAHSIDVFYDVDWNKLELRHRDGTINCDIRKPPNLQEMLSVATKLSSNFDFVRVDLYNIFEKVKFGELSFTPRAGDYKFSPNSWDTFLGRKWVMATQGRHFGSRSAAQ